MKLLALIIILFSSFSIYSSNDDGVYLACAASDDWRKAGTFNIKQLLEMKIPISLTKKNKKKINKIFNKNKKLATSYRIFDPEKMLDSSNTILDITDIYSDFKFLGIKVNKSESGANICVDHFGEYNIKFRPGEYSSYCAPFIADRHGETYTHKEDSGFVKQLFRLSRAEPIDYSQSYKDIYKDGSYTLEWYQCSLSNFNEIEIMRKNYNEIIDPFLNEYDLLLDEVRKLVVPSKNIF